MARTPDLPCTDCGRMMARTHSNLPEGQARCHPCRRLNPTVPSGPLCSDCGKLCSYGAIRCKGCYLMVHRSPNPKPRKPKPEVPDPRQTRAWRKLRDRVVMEEPACWLRLPVCTGISVTADHVITVKERPDLALARSNLHGACDACNRSRGSRPISQLMDTAGIRRCGL